MLKGNLKTISLPSLVQAICLEQRKAALFLENDGLEGVMYFDQGQIAHASLGGLMGDQAVVEMAGWQDGSFHISPYEVLPRRTITTSWNHLLMEGMRQLDEKLLNKESRSVELNLTESQVEHDNRVENGLITMLADLEFERASLQSRAAKGGSKALISSLIDMVTTIDRYLDAAPVPMDKVGRGEFIAPDICGSNGNAPATYQESLQCLKDLLPSIDESESVVQAAEAFHAFEENVLRLFRGYFCLFSNHYYSPLAADDWIEASSIYVAELEDTLIDLKGRI